MEDARVKELMGWTVAALRKYASQLSIKNAKQYRKAELVQRIAEAEQIQARESEKVASVGVMDDKERAERKVNYIETAPVGTIVAFKTPSGKVKSAAIVNRSAKHRKLRLQTKYGAEFIANYSDVLWVRTDGHWPKAVYKLLRGIEDERAEG